MPVLHVALSVVESVLSFYLSPLNSAPKCISGTQRAIMSFFKKLANEFENLTTGDKDKDRGVDQNQQYGQQGQGRWSHSPYIGWLKRVCQPG